MRTYATVATRLGVVMMKGYWMCCVRKREWSMLCGEATRYCTLADQALALSMRDHVARRDAYASCASDKSTSEQTRQTAACFSEFTNPCCVI